MLIAIRLGFLKEMQGDYGRFVAKLNDSTFWNKAIDRFGNLGSGGIGRKVQVFLSTGNIVSSTGLDLMQVSGYTIVAERLNFLRYCAHFRSVHRGQFFMEMKTTSVRKLLPDQWGFLCPVHTPDGGPCGLLSHLALKCEVLADADPLTTKELSLDDVLISLGVSPVCAKGENGKGGSTSVHMFLPVCVDGRVAGGLPARLMKAVAARLRRMKVEGRRSVPCTLEIVCIPPGKCGPFSLLKAWVAPPPPPLHCFNTVSNYFSLFDFPTSRRYQWWTLSRPFPLHRCCSCNPSCVAPSIWQSRNDRANGAAFYGHCLLAGGCSRGNHHAPRTRSDKHAESHRKLDTFF